jgi:hypothetical protein
MPTNLIPPRNPYPFHFSLLNQDKAKYSCGVRLACPTEDLNPYGASGVIFSVFGLSEHSFHAHKLESTKKSVPIPLLNQDKAKYSCGVRPACPNTENITPLEPQGVKFSMALPEHSFHVKEPNSNEKSVPIPLLNEEKAKWACGVRTDCPDAKILHQLSRQGLNFPWPFQSIFKGVKNIVKRVNIGCRFTRFSNVSAIRVTSEGVLCLLAGLRFSAGPEDDKRLPCEPVWSGAFHSFSHAGWRASM